MANWVLGIDPSSSHNTEANCIGWALFCDGELINHGELEPDPDEGFTRVRKFIRNRVKSILVNDVDPTITVGVESTFLGSNPNIFYGLIRVQSHIEATVLDLGYSFTIVSPVQSFQAATGLKQYPLKDAKDPKSGRSGTRKPAIQAALKERFDFDDEVSEHVHDACAIALAVIHRNEKSAV